MNELEGIAFYLIHCLLSLLRLNKWVGLTAEVAASRLAEKCDSWESSNAVIISAKWMIESRLANIGFGHVFACQGSPQIAQRLLNLICAAFFRSFRFKWVNELPRRSWEVIFGRFFTQATFKLVMSLCSTSACVTRPDQLVQNERQKSNNFSSFSELGTWCFYLFLRVAAAALEKQ